MENHVFSGGSTVIMSREQRKATVDKIEYAEKLSETIKVI